MGKCNWPLSPWSTHTDNVCDKPDHSTDSTRHTKHIARLVNHPVVEDQQNLRICRLVNKCEEQ